jgi:hypothetical protein
MIEGEYYSGTLAHKAQKEITFLPYKREALPIWLTLCNDYGAGVRSLLIDKMEG